MTPTPSPVILTTDFGLKDAYVGVLKGVILSIAPDATIIDLTHLVSPQNIREAARVIGLNYRYFPDRSVHLCIVDPGVGTLRRIIAVDTGRHYFVGPDNGVFTRIFAAEPDIRVYDVSNERWFLDDISTTFHGRDIMAPTAARLAGGEPIEAAGPQIPVEACTTIALAQPAVTPEGISGVIESVDRFGNLISNIPVDLLAALGERGPCRVFIHDHTIAFGSRSYADLPDNTPAALVNSGGWVEITVKNDSAARVLSAAADDRILIKPGL